MGRPFIFKVNETLDNLSELHKNESHIKVKQRLHMLYLCKSGLATSLTSLCFQLNKSPSQVKRWIKTYKDGGIDSLIKPPVHRGRNRSINDTVMMKLKEKLDDAYFSSFKDIHLWLKNEYGVTIGYHAVWHQTRHLGAKLKTARPCAIQRNEVDVIDFKKNSPVG